MATAWNPAAASAGSWWRHEREVSGNPCTRSTSGPVPCSVSAIRPPGTSTVRCVGAGEVASMPGSLPGPTRSCGDPPGVVDGPDARGARGTVAAQLAAHAAGAVGQLEGELAGRAERI